MGDFMKECVGTNDAKRQEKKKKNKSFHSGDNLLLWRTAQINSHLGKHSWFQCSDWLHTFSPPFNITTENVTGRLTGLACTNVGKEKRKIVQHYRWDSLVLVQWLKMSELALFLLMLPPLSRLPIGAHDAPLQWHFKPLGCDAELQHGYALRGTVEMCGRTASPGGLEALSRPAQRWAPGPGAHYNPWAKVVTLLQACHHSLAGDGAKLVGEGAVEDQDVHCEDPLADGRSVLQDEALVDEEDAAWEEEEAKEDKHLCRIHEQNKQSSCCYFTESTVESAGRRE